MITILMIIALIALAPLAAVIGLAILSMAFSALVRLRGISD
jgi:hypothetical protein